MKRMKWTTNHLKELWTSSKHVSQPEVRALNPPNAVFQINQQQKSKKKKNNNKNQRHEMKTHEPNTIRIKLIHLNETNRMAKPIGLVADR